MKTKAFRILCFGDVVGENACLFLRRVLPGVRREYGADFVITNGENSGKRGGIDPESMQQLYSAADVVVVGRYAGEKALAGVGTCTVLVNLFLNFIMGFAAGATIVLGQAFGAKDNDKIEKATHTTMALAIWCGAAITAICLLFSNQLLGLIAVPYKTSTLTVSS